MTTVVCEVIKKNIGRPGIRSCIVIHFIPKMARYCAGIGRRVANDGSECIHVRTCAIVMENQR